MHTQTVAPRLQSQPLRTGIIEWAPGDELIALVAEEVAHLGHEVVLLSPAGALPPGLDVVLVFGPFGSLAPLMAQLISKPPGRRPLLVWWLTEQLWHPWLPHALARGAAELRSGVERLVMRAGARSIPPSWRRLTGRGLRFRYYGDMLWLRRHGLLSVFAVPSQWLAEFLRGRGFEITQAFVGSHPSFAAQRSTIRDIPVLWLGTDGSTRRRRNLERITDQLARRGIELTRVDGLRHPPAYGAERARLLSRSKIVLNLLRHPWDSNMLRFILAAPNRALMISEPLLPHYPVRDGIHLVETPLDAMADAVCRYLDDEAARMRITDQAYRLVTTDLTLARGTEIVMRQVAQLRATVASQ